MPTLSDATPPAASPPAEPKLGAGRALYAEVADVLRRRILQRQLLPGSWIDELKLADELGISRTPLREAIKVLAAEGLVTMKVRRGAYVTEVPESEVREIYHVLGLLESDAAADVARHATLADLAELQRLHDALVQSAGTMQSQDSRQAALVDDFFAINQQFHQRLLEISGNRWRMQIVTDLRKVMQLGRHHSLFKQGRIQQSLSEHAAIMQALQNHDPAAARSTMQHHFAQGLVAAG